MPHKWKGDVLAGNFWPKRGIIPDLHKNNLFHCSMKEKKVEMENKYFNCYYICMQSFTTLNCSITVMLQVRKGSAECSGSLAYTRATASRSS